MSLRRRSCDPCFNGKRKCDLTYPTCARCHNQGKSCQYAYPPQLPENSIEKAHSTVVGYHVRSPVDLDKIASNIRLQPISISKLLDTLGEAPPITGKVDWQWVFDQVRSYPLMFAKRAETPFIHGDLCRHSLSRPLRAALGICAACVDINDHNRKILFQTLDAEIAGLLAPPTTGTLLEELAKLQAAVLYQVIRIFYGGVEQQIMAERQEYLLRSNALTLVRRADAELHNESAIWEIWILAESIRRTAIIAFKLYTMYWSFKSGVCQEYSAMEILPVSSKMGAWRSRDDFVQSSERETILPYQEFTSTWEAAPRTELEPFEKFLLVSCKGISHYDMLVASRNVMRPTYSPLNSECKDTR